MKQNQTPFPSLSGGTTNTIGLVQNLNRILNCHITFTQRVCGFEAFFYFDGIADSAPRFGGLSQLAFSDFVLVFSFASTGFSHRYSNRTPRTTSLGPRRLEP
jgi:hypothetical protein